MNKLFKGVMLVCFFTLFSCQQDEMLYSCDPEVNEYIKSNSFRYTNYVKKQVS